MINILFSNLLRFVLLVLFQVLILNNIQFAGYLNPFLYVLFILMFPFDIPKPLLLIVAFITGLFIDMFSNTMGMHASACVFLGFIRPYILRYIEPRGGYEHDATPSIKDMGLTWYLSYAGVLVFLHHLLLFYLEIFRLSEFFSTLYRVVLSSCFSMLLILLSQYLIFGKRK
ncbi:MAG TPA: rod shape-determining protein MreD [Flavobacteriales bacterium]|nr:rod shape-determining protein MreD [Flavobacteriales bacterium]HIN39139.1 rod shape-determining protein MreD [Flavobacteriales bacterium]